MHFCCKKLIQQQANNSGEVYLSYMNVIFEVLMRERFKAAWLQSPNFFNDL